MILFSIRSFSLLKWRLLLRDVYYINQTLSGISFPRCINLIIRFFGNSSWLSSSWKFFHRTLSLLLYLNIYEEYNFLGSVFTCGHGRGGRFVFFFLISEFSKMSTNRNFIHSCFLGVYIYISFHFWSQMGSGLKVHKGVRNTFSGTLWTLASFFCVRVIHLCNV